MGQFLSSVEVTSGLLGIETNLVLLRVPNPTSIGQLFIVGINAASISAANSALIRLYKDPTITSNGTNQTIIPRNIDDATTSGAAVSTSPTISNRGTLIGHIAVGKDTQSIFADQNLLALFPGNAILFTITGTVLSQIVAMDLFFDEG